MPAVHRTCGGLNPDGCGVNLATCYLPARGASINRGPLDAVNGQREGTRPSFLVQHMQQVHILDLAVVNAANIGALAISLTAMKSRSGS